LALSTQQHQLRDIAAAVTDRIRDHDLADLTGAGKITKILTDLTHPAAPVPADAETGETRGTNSIESEERRSA